MSSYSLLDAVLDLTGLACTVISLVWFIFGLEPLFARVRDSCRACQPPEGRAQLLWSVFLINIAWVLAVALYFRSLFSLWDCMGDWLKVKPIDRPVYALLHLYLLFLLFCGIHAWVITIREIRRNSQVFRDLVMIARYKNERYEAIDDLEAQRGYSSTEAETPFAGGNVRNASPLSQHRASRRRSQELNVDVAPPEDCIDCSNNTTEEAPWPGNDPPVGEILTRTVYSAVRPSNQYRPILDSDGDAIAKTPSSSSSSRVQKRQCVYKDVLQGVGLRGRRENQAPDTIDYRRYLEQDEAEDEDDEDDDDDDDDDYDDDDEHDDHPYGLYYATPRLDPQDQIAETHIEPLDIGKPPSPYDSCSSAHTEWIPTAEQSPERVPITTADANDADTEKTDREQRHHERKTRNATLIPRANAPRTATQYATPVLLDPRFRDNDASIRVLRSHRAAHALEQQASARRAKPNPNPVNTPPFIHDAGNNRNGPPRASRDETARVVSFGRQSILEALRRPGDAAAAAAAAMAPRRRRPASPYPLAERRPGMGGWSL